MKLVTRRYDAATFKGIEILIHTSVKLVTSARKKAKTSTSF